MHRICLSTDLPFLRYNICFNNLARFVFSVYDMDKDGFISREELYTVLKMMVGSNLKEVQLQQVVNRTFRDVDKDMDGKISYEEFAAIIGNLGVEKKMVVQA